VVGPCLQWALETREPYGVWGGMSVEERQAMQSEQRLA
jgi:WhiB family redox-sensing transcriptional regulator